MLGKRKPPPPHFPLAAATRKRRKPTTSEAVIAFDPSAREDYLTGFHKRKLQRAKHAREEAARKERGERIEARKILREGRKADLEKHVEAVNALVREAEGGAMDGDDGDGDGDGDEGEEEGEGAERVAEALDVDWEEEFVDEDRYTTVTVEAVDVSHEGLHSRAIQDDNRGGGGGRGEDGDDGDDGFVKPSPIRGRGASAAAATGTAGENGKREWTKERPAGVKKLKPTTKKKKTKKFRYESKAERKVTRYKERSGNKSKAKARKEE